MGSNSIPFASIQFHRAVSFEEVKFQRIDDFDETDTAISKLHLCVVKSFWETLGRRALVALFVFEKFTSKRM
jgi:hypothetical protein